MKTIQMANIKNIPFIFLLTALFLSFSGKTWAQKKERGTITLSEVTIVGRVQKPIAAVDVSKLQAKLTLSELHEPFLGRIELAIKREPF